MEKVNIFWFRRDLRLHDNIGLFNALQSSEKVLPIFIFDKNILAALPEDDARVTFIHNRLSELKKALQDVGSDLLVFYDTPEQAYEELLNKYSVQKIFTNRDYEPYGVERDRRISELLEERGLEFFDFKDQVIFEKDEVVKDDGKFYTVFTPYSRKWRAKATPADFTSVDTKAYFQNFLPVNEAFVMPTLSDMGFTASTLVMPPAKAETEVIQNYDKTRDIPSLKNGTSRLGLHFRFGTVSIRQAFLRARELNETYETELIWREFYHQILWHNPQIVTQSFKPQYDQIEWRESEEDFQKWCEGKTGYPLVDAGMRELNKTGYMHNRVRMVTASFLCKHLLLDWRKGERYFAQKLLDYDLAANNGGWQWAAGTGCDAAPYFRVFNPEAQQKKFDSKFEYIKKWVPEFGTDAYPEPMVDHKFARNRALEVYKAGLSA